MRAMEYGAESGEVIILLHGGGLSPWNYRDEAERLKGTFRVVLPILDGHAGSDRPFATIQENARALVDWMGARFGGQVLLIGGLSLGGQILVKMLSQRKDICRYALIENALVRPRPVTCALVKPVFSLCYPLVKLRWFAKLQCRSLRIPSSRFEEYYADSAAVRKEDMIAFLLENSRYKLKRTLSECQAKALIVVGGREQGVMKQSAEDMARVLGNSTLKIFPGYSHGEFSLSHASAYVQELLDLIDHK